MDRLAGQISLASQPGSASGNVPANRAAIHRDPFLTGIGMPEYVKWIARFAKSMTPACFFVLCSSGRQTRGKPTSNDIGNVECGMWNVETCGLMDSMAYLRMGQHTVDIISAIARLLASRGWTMDRLSNLYSLQSEWPVE
jgi:hypothetical protein